MLAYTKDNKVIHIKNALPKTDYFCANCGGRLRVRDGKIRAKHFAHINEDCKDRGESLIHKCWKKYFLKLKEFDGYNIIKAEEEVLLLDGDYRPDIVYKTDKGTYIILEICVSNPKTKEYIKKYKRLKKLEKVYEIIVDFGKISDTKILFNREEEKELQIKVEKKRKYILDTYYEVGGLVCEAIKNDGYAPPFLCPYFNKDIPAKYKGEAIDLSWKKTRMYEASLSSRGKKFKVHLEEKSGNIKVKSESFFIMIYDYINMNYYFDTMNTFSIKLVSKDPNLKGDINIVLDKE